MSKQDKDKATLLDVISFLILIILGPFALGAIFNDEYSLPVWAYVLLGGAILYIFLSWQQKANVSNSSSTITHSKTKPNIYQKSSYSPGEIVTTNVVGVSFDGRQKVVSRLQVGDGVFIEREPENLHDENAIKVSTSKYSKLEQEKIESFAFENYDSKIKLYRDQNHALFMEKLHILRFLPNGQEKDTKIQAVESQIAQLDAQIKDLEAERRVELFKKYDKVQIGYLDKELVKKIAPIFDRWAVGPTTVIDGNVIQVTGREDPKLTKGVVIRFRLPDENFLRASINQDMAMYF